MKMLTLERGLNYESCITEDSVHGDLGENFQPSDLGILAAYDGNVGPGDVERARYFGDSEILALVEGEFQAGHTEIYGGSVQAERSARVAILARQVAFGKQLAPDLRNFTPHPVVIETAQGLARFWPEPVAIRAKSGPGGAGRWNIFGGLAQRNWNGIKMIRPVSFRGVEGAEGLNPGDAVIVSFLAAPELTKERPDLHVFSPNSGEYSAIRDEKGKILYVNSLHRWSPETHAVQVFADGKFEWFDPDNDHESRFDPTQGGSPGGTRLGNRNVAISNFYGPSVLLCGEPSEVARLALDASVAFAGGEDPRKWANRICGKSQ